MENTDVKVTINNIKAIERTLLDLQIVILNLLIEAAHIKQANGVSQIAQELERIHNVLESEIEDMRKEN